MDDVDPAQPAGPEALAQHRRRRVLAGLPGWVGVVWLIWAPWVRRAHRARDRRALGAFWLALASAALSTVSTYRRADRAVADELAREKHYRERVARDAEQRARGQTPTIEVFPPGALDPGALPSLTVWSAGLLVAAWNYRHRPDRGRRVSERVQVHEPSQSTVVPPAWRQVLH